MLIEEYSASGIVSLYAEIVASVVAFTNGF